MFATASMTETMNQLKEMYEQNNPNVTITYNFDSSGKLLTQITEALTATCSSPPLLSR